MKKLISMVLMIMILCSLFTTLALGEDAQGQAENTAAMATMSVTGGTINPDGTVTWAVGENILTITMSDGSVYTVTVIYDPEAPKAAALNTLTISGTEIPMIGNIATVATPNAIDTIAVSAEPADAIVSINGTAVENGETTFEWAEGSNQLAIEVSKEGYETTSYSLMLEYTPAQEESFTNDENTNESTASEGSSSPEDTAAVEENIPLDTSSEPETLETVALAGLVIDSKEIDLKKFTKDYSTEKESNYSYNAATNAENDLTVPTSTIEVTAAEGWTVGAVKLNGASLTETASGSYSVQWAKANDLEITLKKSGTDFKAVYSLILSNALLEATVDSLTVNGADVAFLTAIQAAADNSYRLQVSAGEGNVITVTVNGVPVDLDSNGTVDIPAVTGTADNVVITVSKAGCLEKNYNITVNAAPAPSNQTASVTENATSAGSETIDNMVNNMVAA